MNFELLLSGISAFILGGGLMTLITMKSARKKAAVEVKVDEITALHNTIEMVYEPLIKQQKERIMELETEVKSLREQLSQERQDRQKEMEVMNKRILAIMSTLGMQTVSRIRDSRGRYSKIETDVEEQ